MNKETYVVFRCPAGEVFFSSSSSFEEEEKWLRTQYICTVETMEEAQKICNEMNNKR